MRYWNRACASASRARVACAQIATQERNSEVQSMNCHESHPKLIELARSGSPRYSTLVGHLQVCAECSRFVDDQLALHAALAALATETASEPAPESAEARLLAEFDASARSTSYWQT